MNYLRRSAAGASGVVFVPISPELSVAFGTALSLRTVPSFASLNPELERAILKRRDEGLANRISNMGGWQSLPDFLDWPEPCVANLKGEIDRGVQDLLVQLQQESLIVPVDEAAAFEPTHMTSSNGHEKPSFNPPQLNKYSDMQELLLLLLQNQLTRMMAQLERQTCLKPGEHRTVRPMQAQELLPVP